MDFRRGHDLSSAMRASPSHDNEPSAPSPESIAASPMLISSRNSECGDLPIESDEGYGVSDGGETSRRSTLSRMDFYDCSRDADFKKNYPELFKLSQGKARHNSGEVPHTPHHDGREENLDAVAQEIRDLYKKSRDQDRQLRELRRNYKAAVDSNKQIRDTYGKIYARAEQEEEYISNTLLKRIHQLKNEKELLAQRYEKEEMSMTNELMAKVKHLQTERDMLEGKLKNEQATVVDGLMHTIRRMDHDISTSRQNIERLRKEKVDQENALEHEAELLFNTLGKKMHQLNIEKRNLQASLEKAYVNGFVDSEQVCVSSSSSSNSSPYALFGADSALCNSGEISRLKAQLKRAEGHVNELKERDAHFHAKIRHLEETNKSLLKYKEHVKTIKNMLDSDTISPQMSPMVSTAVHRQEINMGPPSVPATPRSFDNGSDMDDGCAPVQGSPHDMA